MKQTWIVRLLVLAAVAFCTTTLWRMNNQIRAEKEKAASLTERVTVLEQENQRLQQDIDALQTDEGVRDVARKELGMVASGEIVFRDVG